MREKQLRMSHRKRRRWGRVRAWVAFTLIEIVLAVGIGGLILAAASEFLFSIANLWAQSETEPVFDEHVESVSQFLEYTFDSTNVRLAAASSTQDNPSAPNPDDSAQNDEVLPDIDNVGSDLTALEPSRGEASVSANQRGISWKTIPGNVALDDKVIAFRVSGQIPIFIEENNFIPEVNAYLKLNRETGLTLIWQTDIQAEEDPDDTYETVVSPWVTELKYLYYDFEDDNWTESDEMEESEEGEPMLPTFIKLKFVHDDSREKEVFVLLPNGEAYVPQF